MSDQNDQGNAKPAGNNIPSNSGPRIGRIGQWGGSDSSPGSSRPSSTGRIATLRDLNPSSSARPPASGSDDEEEGKEGETLYAGGEKSGLSVQNPNRGGNVPDESNDLLRSLLKKAADAGRLTSSGDSASPPSRAAFSGSGHTLGSDEVESQFIPDPSLPAEQTPTKVARHITFWRNGFSVEDGPLMDYNDPQNAEILRAIESGQAPAELMKVRYGQPVELRIVPRMEEDYVPQPHAAFEGTGHRLGAPTPAISRAGPSSSSSAQASSSAPVVRGDEPQSVQTKFEVDKTQPTTSIQLRFADGSRMLCSMNLTHTVQDIRNFINASRPGNSSRAYTISVYPNRVLGDNSQTLEAAGLKEKTVVTQRLKA